MNKISYEKTRAALVKERKRLLDLLESQGDFPNQADILAHDANKRTIINLDDEWNREQRGK
jgi:hypothetical protein